eukprot:scaffold11598_cov73-Phaeocystis_antarctica.AAC.3
MVPRRMDDLGAEMISVGEHLAALAPRHLCRRPRLSRHRLCRHGLCRHRPRMRLLHPVHRRQHLRIRPRLPHPRHPRLRRHRLRLRLRRRRLCLRHRRAVAFTRVDQGPPVATDNTRQRAILSAQRRPAALGARQVQVAQP